MAARDADEASKRIGGGAASGSEASMAELGVGTVLAGSYRLLALIGRGGMGTVWVAEHLRLPKRVAVKVLQQAPAADSEAYARFRREAEIASRLGHPNIVEVLDFDVLPSGVPFLVLEFLDGESLAQRLRHGAMSVENALSVARQVASALAAAHRHAIVHRDLKPDNVFLCPREVDGDVRDHVKVLDFGISKIRGSDTVKTQESALLGTPQYMAPEQARGENTAIDARTDVYALGAITYEMLSGRPPFSGESLAQLVFRVVFEPPPALAGFCPGLPPAILAAVERAMSKDPEARPADVSQFVVELTGRPLATPSIGQRLTSEPVSSQARTKQGFAPVDSQADTEDHRHPPPSMPVPPPVTATTAPRGEVAAARPRPTRRAPVVVGALAAIATAIALLLWVGGEDSRPPEPQLPTYSMAPDGTSATLPDAESEALATAPAASPRDAAPEQLAMATPSPTPPAPAVTASPTGPPSREDRELPAEAVADLTEADELIEQRRFDVALHRARRAMQHGPAARARAAAVMTVAYCGQGDLGNANASLRQVPRKQRNRVVARCRNLGLELDAGAP